MQYWSRGVTWLNWTQPFGPISGLETKLDDPVARYLMTTFCYGCYLGPRQTVRSSPQVARRQLSHVHRRHISEDKLQQAMVNLVNPYHRFKLPRYWGLESMLRSMAPHGIPR